MKKTIIDYEALFESGEYDFNELNQQIVRLDDEDLLTLHDRLTDYHMNVMVEMRRREIGELNCEEQWMSVIEAVVEMSDCWGDYEDETAADSSTS